MRTTCCPMVKDVSVPDQVSRTHSALALTFLGTRGGIEIRSGRHNRHSSLLVERDGLRVMIDCGTDWLGLLPKLAPTAVVLTHAHLDHVGALAEGAPCPVFASRATWDLIKHYPIEHRRRLDFRKVLVIGGLRFEAFPLEHSIRAPTVGYRVSIGGVHFFYAPDVARIPAASRALGNVSLYIGDGATMTRSMTRRRGRNVIGHATIASQLAWCGKAGVRHAIFTHCGSPIVRGEARALAAALRQLGAEHSVDARFACDGERLRLSQAGYRWASRGDDPGGPRS